MPMKKIKTLRWIRNPMSTFRDDNYISTQAVAATSDARLESTGTLTAPGSLAAVTAASVVTAAVTAATTTPAATCRGRTGPGTCISNNNNFIFTLGSEVKLRSVVFTDSNVLQ